MSSWEEIGEKWNRVQQMGWQSVQAALDLGDDLIALKAETPHGEWGANLGRALNLSKAAANTLGNDLMRLARDRPRIEQAQPESMRKALALLPRGTPRPRTPAKAKPPVTSDAGAAPAPSAKAITRAREEVIDLEEFAKKTARDQAAILTRKQVKVELARLKSEADAEVQETLKAMKEIVEKKLAELEEERKRVTALGLKSLKDSQLYTDLINQRFNGYDLKHDLKILRQASHPDRPDVTTELRTKAMLAIDHIAQCLGLAA